MALLGALVELFSMFQGTWVMPMKSVDPTDALFFDACTGRVVTRSGEIVDFAVEDGFATDNRFRNPTRVSVEGTLSDTPTHPLALAKTKLSTLFGGGQNSELGITKLREWDEASTIVRVVTPRWQIKNLGILTFSHEENDETGASYNVSLEFKSVRIITSALIPDQLDFDAAQLGAGGTVDLGTQGGIDPANYTGPITLGGGG